MNILVSRVVTVRYWLDCEIQYRYWLEVWALVVLDIQGVSVTLRGVRVLWDRYRD